MEVKHRLPGPKVVGNLKRVRWRERKTGEREGVVREFGFEKEVHSLCCCLSANLSATRMREGRLKRFRRSSEEREGGGIRGGRSICVISTSAAERCSTLK